MKKFNTSLKNQNVQATIVIAIVFAVTGLISLFFILAD
jgi:hypothetical protein